MENANHRLEVGMQIGDYLLQELIYDGPTTRTWKAQQISVDREVIIDSLNRSEQDNEEIISTFLSDVRAKAHVDHPLIGSVFEALREDQLCFYARESLCGQTLEELADCGTIMRPEKVVHILRQIAEANLYLEEHKIASLPIGGFQIFIAEHSLCRLINMAVGGERDHNVATQDKHAIATAFMPLLQEGCSGSTRTLSLLNYMADLEREIPLTWEQIRELSEEVELQLSEPSVPLPLSSTQEEPNKSKPILLLAGAGIGAALVLALGATFLNQAETPKERTLTDSVHIPAGKYLTHEGSRNKLNEFWVDSHEVTIAEYAKFLEAMELFTPEESEIYQHPDQPAAKTDHLPADWSSLLTAARNGTNWNGIQLDLNCPIIGIDWWDAYAYCAYNRRRLPTQDEWNAILRHSEANALPRSDWGPVDQQSPDITSNGIYGLAGNVSEWTANASKDPTFPTKPEMPVVCGGSYLKKSSSADSREWLSTEQTDEPDARSIRRGDIGFRTISNRPD